jgi:hypothetical protein
VISKREKNLGANDSPTSKKRKRGQCKPAPTQDTWAKNLPLLNRTIADVQAESESNGKAEAVAKTKAHKVITATPKKG